MPQQTTFRRHERLDWQGEVTVVGRTGMFRGQAENISETGIAIALPKSFADITVTIEIADPSGEGTLSLAAARCHNAEGFHGFRFVSLSPAQRALLRRLCESLGR